MAKGGSVTPSASRTASQPRDGQLQSPEDVTRKFVDSWRVGVQTVAFAVEPVVMGENGMTATPTFPLKTKLAATFR